MVVAALKERHAALERRINAALPPWLKVGAFVLYCYTEREHGRLAALADRPVWDRWHDAAVGLLLALQVGGLALLAGGAALALTRNRATALNDPANTIAIPGFNEFMPLAAAPYVIGGLVLATVVHEGGHAVATRRAGIPIREYGVALLFGVVPLAAYVLPADELDVAPRRQRLRVFAAGVANNVVLAAVALGILLLPWTTGPGEAFRTYFGWALTSAGPPTAGIIAGTGVVSNLAFWTALLSANFGLLNALPVVYLDGGRVLSLSLEAAGDRLGRPIPETVLRVTVHALGVFAIVVGVLAVVGPHLT